LDENALRGEAARLAAALADQLDAALSGNATEDQANATHDIKLALLARFTATPYRPTGLAAADQAGGAVRRRREPGQQRELDVVRGVGLVLGGVSAQRRVELIGQRRRQSGGLAPQCVLVE